MIFLTVAILSGCSSCLKDFQKKHRIYQINVTHQVCEQYRIDDFLKDKYTHEATHPLSYCHGFFSVSPEAYNDARNCAQDTAQNCK